VTVVGERGQGRHREIGRAHEDQAKGHEAYICCEEVSSWSSSPRLTRASTPYFVLAKT
jgi:hypothetical protein